MSIKITREPDVHVTAGELARYQKEYRDFMAMYAGPPITIEEFIRGRQRRAQDCCLGTDDAGD